MEKKADEVLESAIEFIRNSCDIYDNISLDQPRRLKHSTIDLSLGIELVLKARLCQEHWSLILSDPDKYKEKDWETGQFTSVTINDCFRRLKTLIDSPLPEETQKAVFDLSKLRNQYVHFVCGSSKEHVTAIQLRAWHHIIELLDGGYLKLTTSQSEAIEYVKGKMLEHSEFIEKRFLELQETIQSIESGGYSIIYCPFCEKKALRIGDETKCIVCGDKFTNAEKYAHALITNSYGFDYKEAMNADSEISYCSECGDFACIPAPSELEENAIKEILRQKNINNEPGFDIEPYICISCGSVFEEIDIQTCARCGSRYTFSEGNIFCPICRNGEFDEI